MVRVSRGLIGVTNRFDTVMRPSSTDDVTERVMGRLIADRPHGSMWKERMQWAQNLARGGAEFYGRRVLTDAGRSDCRYVARIARAAYHKGELPRDKSAWGRLRESIRRIYQDLNAGIA